MNVGILVYSYTGNTLSVAEKIKEQLEKQGHTASIEKITAVNGDPNGGQPIQLQNIPDVSAYDRLIVGAPVNGMALCKAMKMYLKSHGEFAGKEVNCFITQHFKFSAFGGNQGMKGITSGIKAKGGVIKNTAIVHWSSPNKDEEINAAASAMAAI